MTKSAPQTVPTLASPLTRIEVVAWVALVDAWMAPSCPARCPNIPERARLREALVKVRARGLVGVIDERDHATIQRVHAMLERYDVAITRLAPRGHAFVLAAVSSLFELVFCDQPDTWRVFTDALARVDRKILADLAAGREVFPEDYEACRLAEAMLAYVRDSSDEALAAWSKASSASEAA